MFRNIGKKEDFAEIKVLSRGGCIIEWDKQPLIIKEYNEDGEEIGEHEDPILCSWMQENFKMRPDLQVIKDVVLGYYDNETDKKILNGFSWNPEGIDEPINIYLSSENQFNYKAAYDLAYQTNGQSLPFKLKFGQTDSPQYYEFTNLETFSNFYLSSINFINTTLQEGWDKKDSIDWSKYGD